MRRSTTCIPTNHKFYGYMDFFSWQNLHDVRAIFTIKPTARMSVAFGRSHVLGRRHSG